MRAGLLLALLLSLVVARPALAAADAAAPEIDLEELATARTLRQRLYPPRPRIMRYTSKAVRILSEGDAPAARALLERLNLKRLNPYERAQIYRLHGYVSYQTGDLPSAIESFTNANNEQILPIKDEAELRFSIAQLYAALSNWDEVIKAIDSWALYVPERSPLSHYLLAIANYQLDDFDAAIVHAKRAVAGDDPKEVWLQLLAALYVKKQDYKSAAPVLEELVMRFRKKEYWSQLSLIYGALDDFRGSLAVQQLAYMQGLLTEDKELRRLARGFLYNELPYPAARILEKGIADGAIEPDVEGYELLANSWIAAREYEKSLEPLRKAADLAEDGNLFVRLGQVHMQREDWSEAVRLFQKAIAKGGLKDTGNAHLLLGISLYNADSVPSARASFARARQHETSRTQADAWIEHIEKESQQRG